MLKRIENQEIMTSREAKKRYRDKYFYFMITKEVDRADNDLGYVLYTYDNEREWREIPREELKDKAYEVSFGEAVEPMGLMGFGRILFYDTTN